MTLAQMRTRCKPTLLFLGALLWLSSCALQTVQRWPIPSIGDDLDGQSLRDAVAHSIDYLQKLPPERLVGEQPVRLTAGDVLDSLEAFSALLADWHCLCFRGELEERFDLLPSSADEETSEVLFTGYYQPVIDGSLVRSEVYRFPIYGYPDDLVAAPANDNGGRAFGRIDQNRLVPYFSRRDIDQLGLLQGRGLEIAWVKDPIELFFLHIQGSGLLRLPDGTTLNVGYATQNGWPYRSIGRLLIDNGKVAREEMSMQRLRRYLLDNPNEQNDIFAYNESYVFFRVVPNGPLGSLEVPVTAQRSIATDSRLFPKGALALIQTEVPVIDGSGQLVGWRPVTRFVLNQDTGGAIRGLQRTDYYFGSGDQAGASAGYMNRPGRLFFLVLKKNAVTH